MAYDAGKACDKAMEQFQQTLDELKQYVAHASISSDETHRKDIENLARAVCGSLTRLGMEATVRCLDKINGNGAKPLPLVTAEWENAGSDKPTVLIYGHLDVQPVDEDKWTSKPFEAIEKNGRLYGRGTSDDKGGWMSHIAAIRAWLDVYGKLPCNVKLVLESEEEIGSVNLHRYMDTFPDCFDADFLVLTDCDNPDTQIPGLTMSLRGLMEVTLTCKALKSDVHSGMWGGMVPDVSLALMRIISRITDENGRLVFGDIEVPEAWKTEAGRHPITEEDIRMGGRILDGVNPLPENGRQAAEWLWRQSCVTVVATTLPTPDRKTNALRSEASAILSIRIGPTADSGIYIDELYRALETHIMRDVPQGVIVEMKRDDRSMIRPWLHEIDEKSKPAFDAADRAYRASWGTSPARIGVGGSIGFATTFAETFPGVPLLLNGVMDPDSGAHGPDESQDIEVLKKAVKANIHLLNELGSLARPAG